MADAQHTYSFMIDWLFAILFVCLIDSFFLVCCLPTFCLLSCLFFVCQGEASQGWIDELVTRASRLKVGNGMDTDTDIGPIITKEAQPRIEDLIQAGVDDGAALLLDGRGVVVESTKSPPGCLPGNYVGPTILAVDLRDTFTASQCADTANMCQQDPTAHPLQNRAYLEEIFGPVLLCVKVDVG